MADSVYKARQEAEQSYPYKTGLLTGNFAYAATVGSRGKRKVDGSLGKP